MKQHNFSLEKYFEERFKEIKPEYHFVNGKFKDFKLWKQDFKKKLTQLLGEFPKQVPLNAEIISKVDCDKYIRYKVVYDTEKYFSIPAWLLVPKGAKEKKEKYPAVLALHGHGFFGKDSVVGIIEGGECNERKNEINSAKYNYGQVLAEEGYVVLAPDARVFGELKSIKDPFGRDPCNINFIKALYLGDVLLTLNIWDMMKAIDYLLTLPYVDREKIGACGLSFGGTRTTYISIFDNRVKASVIMGYMPKTIGYVLDPRGMNTCGSQFLPGIYKYGDVSDIIGLIAPKPLMLQAGIDDTCFPIEQQRVCCEEVKKIYKSARAEDKLEIDIFSGGHQCHPEKMIEFFNKYLR